VKEDWDDMNSWTQAMVLAFSQLREYEDVEEYKNLLRSNGAKI